MMGREQKAGESGMFPSHEFVIFSYFALDEDVEDISMKNLKAYIS